MRAMLMCAVGFVVAMAAGTASGQEPAFGDPGHVALSAERLSGYVHTKETQTTAAGVEVSQSQDSFTLLANPLGAFTGYAWPRIAFDGFVARGVSVGGAVAFFQLSPSTGSISGFLFAPRVGFAANMGPRAAIWPRLGITYEQVSSESGTGNTSKQTALALTVEAPIAISVVPRVMILLGPTLDLGLAGTQSGGGTSVDSKYTEFGFQAGLLVLL